MKQNIAGIEVEIVKKKIKNLHLYILSPGGSVRVTVPKHLSDESIKCFVLSKLDWIEKKREKILSQPQPALPSFSDGDRILLFGRRLRLSVREGARNSVRLEGERIILNLRGQADIKQREKLINEFYRQQLRDEISRRLPVWEKITGLYCPMWQIKNMKTRWGSCNTQSRRIWFNLQLAKVPAECLDYVILHELAHLKVPNHSENFKRILSLYMPGWENAKKLLNEGGWK